MTSRLCCSGTIVSSELGSIEKDAGGAIPRYGVMAIWINEGPEDREKRQSHGLIEE